MPSFGLYPDGRPSRACRLPKVTLPGGGYISKGEDGRLAVAGRECLHLLFNLSAFFDTLQRSGFCAYLHPRLSQLETCGKEVGSRLTVPAPMSPGHTEVCSFILYPYPLLILTSVQQQDPHQCTQWRTHHVGRSKDWPLKIR
jgi:hypothetical protein